MNPRNELSNHHARILLFKLIKAFDHNMKCVHGHLEVHSWGSHFRTNILDSYDHDGLLLYNIFVSVIQILIIIIEIIKLIQD